MAKLVDDTPLNRVLIRAIIFLFSVYAPFCLGYVTWSAVATRLYPFLSLGFDDYLNRPWLWALCFPEAVFYVFFIWFKQYVNRGAIHPPKRTRDERLNLFNKARSEIYDPVSFLGGWFRGAQAEDIGRDELRRFVDWAFWEGRAGEDEKDGDEKEIEDYIRKIEKMMPRPFPEGPGKAKSLRLTLDPVDIEARSLLWYGLIMLVDTIAIALLMAKGFCYHRRRLWELAAVFPPRPAALLTRNVSVVPEFSYFLREHTSKTRLGIVYLHGIGVGLLPGVKFLDELHHKLNDGHGEDDQVGIIALEFLQISSRLTKAMPRKADFLAQLTRILDRHIGEGRFVLAAHSYGTIMSAQVLRDRRLSSRVSATLLIDPVSFLLHMPDVAYNFTARKPVRANEWLLWYFASKDPQIAHTLGRHFFWSENVLWRDQIDHLLENHGMRLTVSLASDDLIVNTRAVRDYLECGDVPDVEVVKEKDGQRHIELQSSGACHPVSKAWRGKGLETFWWDGHDHAGVFDQKIDRAQLIKVLDEYVKGR